MSTPAQLPLAARPHRNSQLFSDHYLDVALPRRAEWGALAADAEPVMRAVADLLARYRPSQNEAQTERDLVRPVLELLGHTFEVQPSLQTPGAPQKPDYVFYRDEAARNANRNRLLTEELLRPGAFAVGDAKYWDRPLDVSLRAKGDAFTNRNPSYQIAFYMQHSGAAWGVLTNGRLWRLYHRDTAHKLDRYYEVDLHALATGGDAERFLAFYGFFRRAAFEPHPLGVAALLHESAEYAVGVGETLKSQVYEALRHLAQGFLDYAPNGLARDPDTLARVYDASLIVLYRLLFVLYAEARELLPVRESADYRAGYSLQHIKEDVARTLDMGHALLPGVATVWPRLTALFGIIDAGSPPLRVATFNGGLFDPARHPFLERNTVGDAHLLRALDGLARVGPPGRREFVDYRDLAERHLGTIYEGLLEYHLAPSAASDGALPQTGKSAPPDAAANGAPGWTVDLVNDKGERKATGSYYTPDFIVKYMVDQTVGPVLRAAVAGLATDEERVRAVLGLNVLDPAMGSGHFLVEATEYVARFLIALGVTSGEEAVGTGTGGRSGGAETATTGTARNGRPAGVGGGAFAATETVGPDGRESELAYWKRRVVQSCIYGVDLNPLTVDLAKLSLWLSTVAKDRPLSFLDHHLRAGNGLVGARMADLQGGGAPARRTTRSTARAQEQAGQLSMLDDEAFRRSMSTAVDSMWLIESSPARTVAEVKEQERIHAALREELTRRYARLADLVTAARYGVTVDPALWRPLADYAAGRTAIPLPGFEGLLGAADAAARERRFFHWELEFPEVFYDERGGARGVDAGFDAVIGNPPYVRQEELGPLKPYFAAAYPETYHGVADLYVYFYQRGLELTRAGGRMSYIVTNKWMRAGYGEPLRAFFSEQGALEQIVDFGHAPIFPDADVFPCILVLEKPGGERGAPAPAGSGASAAAGMTPATGATAPPAAGSDDRAGDGRPDAEAGDPRHPAGHAAVGSGLPRAHPAAAEPDPAGAGSPRPSAPQVRVVAVPRAALGTVDLSRYVEDHAHAVPRARFGRQAWTLETSAVDELMAKIRAAGVPLAEYAGAKPYRGVLTGLNEAFLIDTPTRERLVAEDPKSAEILKPYLRGQDIKRWAPEWRGLWMIFARRGIDIEAYPAVKRHLGQFRSQLEPRPRDWGGGEWPGRKPGQYKWYEIQDAVDYWGLFNRPKIIYQVIQFYPQYGLDDTGVLSNDKTFFIPSSDQWLLAALNTPLLWWHNWRYLGHMKDEALNPAGWLMEKLSIAPPTDAARAEAEPAVGRLIEIARLTQRARADTLYWLRAEFGVEAPGQRLEEFAALDEEAFVEEVRKRRPRSAGRLSPAGLADLRRGYAEQAGPVRALRAEAAALERRLSTLVNAAYGLTPEEEALLWATAPPRTPRY